jgi:hypothetical protein
MIFRRSREKPKSAEDMPRMRGRNRPEKDHREPFGSSIRPSSDNPLARRFMDDEEPATIELEQHAGFDETAQAAVPESATREFAGDERDGQTAEQPSPSDHVAGFLVIVEGPGRGVISNIFYGVNSIGRDPSQRLSLDHGDELISRQNHCLVTYDPASRKFYLQPGGGPNPTFLDGSEVSAPVELTAGNQIGIGATVLRFLPLCGEDFSWEA